MNFFNFVHRSIFDPSFYLEVATFSRKKVLGYFFKLLLFTVLVTGLAQTYYFFDSQRGITKKIEAAFSGMEIKDGILNPNRPTPYVPPPYLMNPIWEQFLGSANLLNSGADSILLIDTSDNVNYPANTSYVFKKKELLFIFNNVVFVKSPYSKLLPNAEQFNFTNSEIRQVLVHYLKDIITSFLLISLILNFFLLLFSVFFLGTAAFIFRVEGNTRYFFYLRTAFFAVTPIAVGTMIIGLSGVKLSWTWHMLIFISTIVMFRAIIAAAKPNKDSGEIQ